MFCYTSELKHRTKSNKLRKKYLLDAGWHTNSPRFWNTRLDHDLRVESPSCDFPRVLVTFASPRDFVSFDPRHLTRSPPIGKRIWVGRHDKLISFLYFEHVLPGRFFYCHAFFFTTQHSVGHSIHGLLVFCFDYQLTAPLFFLVGFTTFLIATSTRKLKRHCRTR